MSRTAFTASLQSYLPTLLSTRLASIAKTTILLALTLATALAAVQIFSTIFVFNGINGNDGYGYLVEGFDGNLYGLTTFGGPIGAGWGNVFKLTPTHQLTSVYEFCSQSNCADGSNPDSLILAKDGNFYGTTMSNGAHGEGTIFKLTPQGTLTVLYNLCPESNSCPPDESLNPSSFIQAADGNFYGTTMFGGTNGPGGCCGAGTAFKMTPAGVLTTLYNFCSLSECDDGLNPNGMIQATDGNFYGLTRYGDDGFAEGGGSVFRITPKGVLTTLHLFCKVTCSDGSAPYGTVIQAADDNLYGTTENGGAHNAGTVFRITLRGDLTTIYNFCAQSNCADGQFPQGGLTQGTDGNFYGTTTQKGSMNGGTIFSLTPSGKLSVLYNFPSWRNDDAGVIQDTDGNFYGSTADQAINHFGIIFKRPNGLGPFVETIPALGGAGARITIVGSNLTGTSGVRFNGRPAVFTQVSSTEIKATVPTGATTGTVTVTLPESTLSSNHAFFVPE